MSMTNPIQLEFAFMRDDKRRVKLAQIQKRVVSSIDFEEYEWHRLRYDRLAA